MATMKDVAREAKVALGTVSKYINNIPIGEEYRLRVEKAIQKLDYQVNTYARGFKMQSTKTVSLIVPDIRDPFFSNFSYYVEAALYQHGYKMFICSSNESRSVVLDYINMAKQNKADGIIAITYSDIDDAVTENIPFISFDRHFSANIPCVSADNHSGGRLAAQKLMEFGCRRLMFLRTGSPFYGETNKRKDGFLEGCREVGVEPEILFVEDSAGELEDFFRVFIRNHLDHDIPLFDGLFAVTDRVAYKAIRVLREFGLRVPEDIQVIGFDGIRKFNDPGADYFVSTIQQPIEKMANCCVQYLLEKKREDIPSFTMFPVEYQSGGTTKECGEDDD